LSRKTRNLETALGGDPSLNRFGTIQQCDGRTDGRTDRLPSHGYDARSILLLRVKTISMR